MKKPKREPEEEYEIPASPPGGQDNLTDKYLDLTAYNRASVDDGNPKSDNNSQSGGENIIDGYLHPAAHSSAHVKAGNPEPDSMYETVP